jgi:hypothetical protein
MEGEGRNLVRCAPWRWILALGRSTITMQDQNGPPPEVSGRPAVRLPGGGWVACGQLVEEPGGSQPYAVMVSAGSFGLSATIPGVPVGTEDFTNHRIGNIGGLTRMRFLAQAGVPAVARELSE